MFPYWEFWINRMVGEVESGCSCPNVLNSAKLLLIAALDCL